MRTKAENRDGANDLAGSGNSVSERRKGDPLSIGELVALIVSDAAVKRPSTNREIPWKARLRADRNR